MAMLTSLLLLVLVAQDRVYKVGEEGVKAPRVVHRVDPEYSNTARDNQIDGVVILSLEISKEGKTEKIEVRRKLEPTLDQNAITAVEQWKFAPATKDGKPVRVKATLEINFRRL